MTMWVFVAFVFGAVIGAVVGAWVALAWSATAPPVTPPEPLPEIEPRPAVEPEPPPPPPLEMPDPRPHGVTCLLYKDDVLVSVLQRTARPDTIVKYHGRAPSDRYTYEGLDHEGRHRFQWVTHGEQ